MTTRWNALLHLPFQNEVASPRRWWMGWFQLLCAWVVCMLLCANIALVLAKGLPADDAPPVPRKPVACGNAGLSTENVVHRAPDTDQPLVRARDCSRL